MKSAFIFLLLAIACAAQSATVPVTLDHNRIIIDVYLPLPDGTQKRVRGWLDNGNADLWVSERVGKLMALQPTRDSKEIEVLGAKVRAVEAPKEVIIGGMKISFAGVKEAKMISAESIAPGSSAEINLPSTVLHNYDVIMDYVDRELTLAAPGQAKFTGKSAKVFVNPPNGLIQIPAKIAGKPYQLSLDLGSCFSMLASDPFQQLAKDNPKWPRNTGAVGTELFWGMQQEAKMQALRVPSVEYGPVKLPAVGFDELPQDFLDFYRKRAGAETSGLIGANALLNYRVGIDYAHSTVYFDQRGSYISPGIDVVGLTLRPELDGRYTIIGVPDYQGKPAVPEAKAGDVLVAVDKVPAKGSTMGQIWSLLEGEPGETRVLTLEREGKQLTVNATVRRFLPVNPLDFSADPCGSPLVESQLWYSVDGTVVEVEDGSTVLMTLTKGHRRVKVHLVGITVTQDGALANEAKQHISDMVFNKTVGVLINTEWLYEKKRPAEITGVVHVKDGAADVGLSLITKGLARTDEPRPYSMSHYTFCKYREAERKAKSDKMGIWQ